jgi:hypothetical protein
MQRRSRRSRERRGNEPIIGARDAAVFKLLTRYRYLDSRQLWSLLRDDVRGTDETGFKKRLRQLTDWGYLWRSLTDRLPRNMLFLGHEIYELHEAGKKHLTYHGIQEKNITGLSAGAGLSFPHALMICSTLASLELGARTAGVRFITWQEILARAPDDTRCAKHPWSFSVEISHRFPTGTTPQKKFKLTPDSPPFGFEYPGMTGKLYRFGVLEAERENRVWCSNLEQTSWLKKTLAYHDLAQRKLYRTQLGLPNFFVFTVAVTKRHIETMKSLILEVTQGKGSGMLLFQRIPAFGHRYRAPPPFPQLFAAPWDRAGHAPLDVSAAQ